jgi:hypothetical protein
MITTSYVQKFCNYTTQLPHITNLFHPIWVVIQEAIRKVGIPVPSWFQFNSWLKMLMVDEKQ